MTPQREPALIVGFIVSIVQMVTSFAFHFTDGQQGVINAIVVAFGGLVTAIWVRSDQLAPAILGLAQAAIAVGLAFGWHLSDTNQSLIMTFIATAVSMFVRTQVTAPAASSARHVLQPV